MAKAGKEGMMNRAEESVHKSGGDKRNTGHTAGVGNERKPDMRGAIDGNPTDGDPLRGAVKHLHSEHPHHHSDHGPHHGGTEHIRHEPMHGMKK